MKRITTAALLAAALASGAMATTITNGNASFSLTDTIFSSTLPTGALITDTGASDQLYVYAWAYRSPAGQGNRPFSYLDTPTVSAVGNQMTLTWTNAGPGASGTARFNAQLVLTLTDGAIANQALVTAALTFTAHPSNTATQTFQLFNLVDLDLNATASNDSVAITDTSAVRATYTESGSPNYAEVLGAGAGKYQVGAGSTLRSNLLNGGLTDLTNAAGPYAGDGAAAFQWSVTLAPGASTTINSAFAINMTAPEPASLVLVVLGALLRRR